MFSKNKKFNKGFTLMELMIVIAIIGIMSAVGFSMWQSSKKDSYLRNAQREVASTIKSAQSYALQGKVQGTPGNESVPYAYGVRFTSTKEYEVFYYEEAADVTDNPTSIENFTLKNGVFADNSNFSTYFLVPFGTRNLDLSVTLSLCHGSCVNSKTVRISGGSVIEN